MAIVGHNHSVAQNPAVTRRLLATANFDEKTEASVNRHLNDELFENDILLTVDQAKDILNEVQDGGFERRRLVSPTTAAVCSPKVSPQSPPGAAGQKILLAKHRHVSERLCRAPDFDERRFAVRFASTTRTVWRPVAGERASSRLAASWQSLIHSAHRHIEAETCIRFIQDGVDSDYLLYTRGSGCWSNASLNAAR